MTSLDTRLLATVAVASLLLSGCSFAPKPLRDDSTVGYKDWASRATNLVEPFGLSLRDWGKPEDSKLTPDGSFLIHSTGWAGNFYGAAGSSVLFGTSGVGSSLGLGLGMGLVTSLFSSSPIEADSWAFGYVSAQEAKTPWDAGVIFTEKWTQAIAKSTKELFPNAEIEVEYKTYKDPRPWYVGAVTIVDESIGCLSYKASKKEDDHCTISLSAEAPREQIIGSLPTLGPIIQAYRVDRKKIFTNKAKKQGIHWAKVIMGAAPYFPEYMVTYVAPHKKFYDERKNPPLVVEKDRINFFVRPE